MDAIEFAIAVSLVASTFWTANDPFVGKWNLNVSRSTIVDEMRVEALGENRYRFKFEGGPAETVVADGTDQPGLPGTTLAVKSEDARNLTLIRKQGSQIIVSAAWKLSQDDETLHDAFTSIQPDGSIVTIDYVYKRLSGTAGFAGSWESTTKPIGLKLELRIQPYLSKGLSFESPGSKKDVIFDGRTHQIPGTRDGPISSGHRRGINVLEYNEATRGKLERARRFELSSDGRTLTETIKTMGRATLDQFVFERG